MEPTRAELELARQAQDGARDSQTRTAKAAIDGGQDARYTTQPGDSLESIAERVYGGAEHAAAIYDASVSSGAIGTDRDQELAAGTVLTLPVVQAPGQPDAGDAAEVASDVAGNRPVGDRPSTTAAPSGRVGGVGDPTARDPDVRPPADAGPPADESPADRRARLEAQRADVDRQLGELD